MATNNTENEIDFVVVVTIIQPALRRLYNMPGAGLDFKLHLKTLRDEVETKVVKGCSGVRDAMKKKEIAEKMHGNPSWAKHVTRKEKAEYGKAEKRWSGMSPELRIKALKATGSHQDDYRKNIGAMGSSLSDVITGHVRDLARKAYEKRTHK